MKLSLIIVLAGVMLVAADPAEELHIAARRGNTADVKKLLEAGAPIEAKNQYGATPLYLAVFNGHAEAALLLLEKGANPNVTDTFYKTSVLDSALQSGKQEVVRALIGKGAVPTARQLNMVVGSGSVDSLNAALAHKFTSDELAAALKAALAAKKEDMAAALRKAGAPESKLVDVPAATLAAYTGDFASAAIPISIKIGAAAGQLTGQGDGQPPFTFSTDSATEFSYAPAGIRVVFDGKDKFTLHQGGQQYPYTRKGTAQTPAVRSVAADVLAKYTGKYSSPDVPLQLDVSAESGQLFVQATGQPRLNMRSESDTEFSFLPSGIRIVFSSPGKLILYQGGQEFSFSRKEGAQ